MLLASNMTDCDGSWMHGMACSAARALPLAAAASVGDPEVTTICWPAKSTRLSAGCQSGV
eukprot:5397704-Prymnesium_polylepis.1